MGNLNPEVNKAEENFELNRPIFIQGLLGSIQGNRISVGTDADKSSEDTKIEKSKNSCILRGFFKSKNMYSGTFFFYNSVISKDYHGLKNSHWVR